MSIASALARGRLAAEARMTSRCNLWRKTGGVTTVGNFEQPEWVTAYTDHPVRIASTHNGAAPSSRIESGGVPAEQARREAHFSASTVLRDGDMIEMTSGDCAGLVFRVVEADPQDQATARRVRVVAAQRPTEWAA
jgi:hypothetical protein